MESIKKSDRVPLFEFRERWCEHFKLSQKKIRELCAETIGEYYEAILKDLVIKQ